MCELIALKPTGFRDKPAPTSPDLNPNPDFNPQEGASAAANLRNRNDFFFILNLETGETAASWTLLTGWLGDRCGRCGVCVCSIWCVCGGFQGESGSSEPNSPTAPAGTPWRQPAVRTASHPWLLQRLNVHRATINPPVSQPTAARVWCWSSTAGRTKPGSASIPSELVDTLLSGSPPYPSTTAVSEAQQVTFK